jgi:hypothetical protein
MGREHRKSTRKRVQLRAWLKYGDDPVLVPCELEDISTSGARLALSGAADIPNEFILFLTETGGAQRQCRAMWRSPTHIGVAFKK